METTAAAMRAKYKVLSAHLDERSLRLCAAGDAKMFGYGGVSFVAEAAELSRTTLYSGSAEVATEPRPDGGRIRKPGGGPAHIVVGDLGAVAGAVPGADEIEAGIFIFLEGFN